MLPWWEDAGEFSPRPREQGEWSRGCQGAWQVNQVYQRVGVRGWPRGSCCVHLTLYRGLRMDWLRREAGCLTEGGEW